MCTSWPGLCCCCSCSLAGCQAVFQHSHPLLHGCSLLPPCFRLLRVALMCPLLCFPAYTACFETIRKCRKALYCLHCTSLILWPSRKVSAN